MISGMALVYDYRVGKEVPLRGCGQNDIKITRRESVEKSRLQARGCGNRLRRQDDRIASRAHCRRCSVDARRTPFGVRRGSALWPRAISFMLLDISLPTPI